MSLPLQQALHAVLSIPVLLSTVLFNIHWWEWLRFQLTVKLRVGCHLLDTQLYYYGHIDIHFDL